MAKSIVFISSFPESLINFRLHLIKTFLANGFHVTAIAPHDENTMAKLKSIGVDYVSIELERNGYNPLKDFIYITRLYLALKKIKPDYIFSYTIKPVIYGNLAAKASGVPHIFSMLTGTGYAFSNTTLKSKLIGFIAQRLFRFSLRHSEVIFFQNKDNLHEFVAKKLISHTQKTAVINGSGVDINQFHVTALPHALSFLMIARLLGDKGVREYAAAAKQIKELYPEVTCFLVGWIDTNPNAIKQTELDEWIKSGYVIYLGKLSDVREAINNCSVYVLPSYAEGTPRTVLESMAMGRPVITTDVPGCRETVIENQNGFLIPPRDVDALVKSMRYFIDHPEKIMSMGQQSREIAEEKYDVNKVNDSILTAMQIDIVIKKEEIALQTLKSSSAA